MPAVLCYRHSSFSSSGKLNKEELEAAGGPSASSGTRPSTRGSDHDKDGTGSQGGGDDHQQPLSSRSGRQSLDSDQGSSWRRGERGNSHGSAQDGPSARPGSREREGAGGPRGGDEDEHEDAGYRDERPRCVGSGG